MTEKLQTEQLVERLKKGDKAAFAELYDNYSASLYGVVSKIVRSSEAGQDVLQDSFVKIWKNIDSFNPKKGSFFTWMLNISRNTAIDKLRKLKKEGKVEIQALDYDVDIVNGNQTKINTNIIGVKESVDKLSPEQKLMVEYIYFNGYTHQEVSDELGIPLGTVKTRIRAAVNELRKVFNGLVILLLLTLI